MLRTLLLLGCFLLPPAMARSQPAFRAVEAAYDIYARGFEVAELQAAFALGPSDYQMQITYHTTGLIGALFTGHQLSTVRGSWQGDRPAPSRFFGDGFWRGEPRRTVIDYDHGHPLLREMVPANDEERDPVPPSQQANTVDTLSALAMLMRRVQNTGRCEAAVTTFDGRRLAEIAAHTAGEEILPPTARSAFSGRALRCDFDGRQLGGFVRDVDQDTLRRPQHGSAWLAEIVPGAPRIPVRITFETRWFGPATMYLTKAAPSGRPLPASN